MNKLLFLISLILVGVLVVGSYVYLNFEKEDAMENKEEKVYQGPVRPTDDLEYFRKTGITRPKQEE